MLLAFACVGLGFAACDENIHDFGKEYGAQPGNLAYIADDDRVFVKTIKHDLDGGESGVDTIMVKFPVHLSEPAKSETRITLDVDNYLIPIYNAANGTTYQEMLGDYIRTRTTELTIPEGQTRSRDSITVAIARQVKDLKNMNGYLIPVKIRNFRGTDVGIDYAQRQSYIAIDVLFENTVAASGTLMVNTASQDLNAVEFKLTSQYTIQSDASVRMTVNNDLIAAFNDKVGGNFQPIAGGLPAYYDVAFAKGAKEGTFKLNYGGEVSGLNDPRGYVVPLEVVSVTGDNMSMPAADKKALYAVVYSNGTAYIADQAEIGTKETDRTGYSATAKYNNGSNFAAPAPNPNGLFMTGSSPATMFALLSVARPVNFVIDFGKDVENVSGFTVLNVMTTSNNENHIRTMDVSLASSAMKENGMRMDIVKGMDFNATDPVRPKVVNVGFDTPVTARYLYLENVMNVKSYMTLNEFFIFTKAE
jgi:hypothetical protein